MINVMIIDDNEALRLGLRIFVEEESDMRVVGVSVGNQQNWDTLRPERSRVGLRSRKLPDGPIVLSSPFDLSRAATRCTTAAEESCTTGTMRKN